MPFHRVTYSHPEQICLSASLCDRTNFNLIPDGPLRGCAMMGGRLQLPKICNIYPTMIKLGTVVPYLKKIQKIHKSLDTPLEFF